MKPVDQWFGLRVRKQDWRDSERSLPDRGGGKSCMILQFRHSGSTL
ncbi:MAG: hypothetical protein ACREP6_03870 [Candidatus Binataceae bacterium]